MKRSYEEVFFFYLWDSMRYLDSTISEHGQYNPKDTFLIKRKPETKAKFYKNLHYRECNDKCFRSLLAIISVMEVEPS